MTEHLPPQPPPPIEPPGWEHPVTEDIIDLAARRNGQYYPAHEYANGVGPNAAEPQPFRMWSLDDLADLPAPTWRIVGVIPDVSFTLLFGPSGSLKSFVAIDMALSVAAGISWQERPVEKGAVLYIAAEGGAGIRKRAAAWLATHKGADLGDRFRVLPHRVDLSDPKSLVRLRATIHSYKTMLDEPPSLIVVDTWSRNTPGVDENSSEKQSKLIDELFDGMAKELGCGVLVVHHSGYEKGRERGSTALPGAADCRWETKRDNMRMTMICRKLKEWAEPPDIEMQAHPVDLDVDEFGDEYDPVPTSLVLLVKDPPSFDRHVAHRQLAAKLRGQGPMSQRNVEPLLDGYGQLPDRRRIAKDAAKCPDCPVVSWTAGQAIMYAHEDDAQDVI